ncbi:hypothetical protein H4R26_002188 [Coemansia thaxteri]|uniref:LAG1-DNAbind-domain-containing protein n=1 Tax=Coemansia thaxteri TaxID=2663907 RepID=A0A9W8BJ89_9FUNG|nr:hypothetical protein H4R26_002188 [Coemansia thaxteri]
MCPAPVNSYFDAQLLADFIMTSQFPEYDGTNTTAATSDSAFGQIGSVTTAFANAVADDYESYDNARARKRRLTVSDDRRAEDLSSFNISDVGDGLFSMLDPNHGYAAAMQQSQSSASSHIMPSSDGSSFNAALAGGMPFNGLSFAQSLYTSGAGGDIHGSNNLGQHTSLLSSPPTSSRAVGPRKHQSLSIAISRNARSNELNGGHEAHTPGMFSPSFMDAMEGAAGMPAGMSSPSMFYSVASPYTPIHAHHHSFSMPNAAQQGHGMGIFHTGLPVGSFGSSDVPMDQGPASLATAATIAPHSLGSVGTFGSDSAAVGASTIGSAEDFSAGLQISMNAAVAAALNNPASYDDSSAPNQGASNASAFSRVQQQGSSGVSQLLGGGQPGNRGLSMDISTTLASFANIPGLESFPPAPMERRQTFAGSNHNSTPFGMLSTEPSAMFHTMDAATSALHGGSVVSPHYAPSTAGAQLMGIAGSLAHGGLVASPAPEPAASSCMQSPAVAAIRRSRKRAATVSGTRTESHPHCQQPSASSAALLSLSMQSMDSSMLLSRASSDSSAYTGPVFNSQAVVSGTGSKVAMVLTSKVAQKSYGTEKRFLCPPPTILLFGDTWKLPSSMGDRDSLASSTSSSQGSEFFASMPRISVSVPTNDGASQVSDFGDGMAGAVGSDSRTTQLEWLARPDLASKPKQHIPHNPVPALRAPREGEPITGRYVAKQLFINDVDEKHKRVTVKVRLHDPSGQIVLNEFDSRPIKVISKPSKKRQSVKNIDLCIHHGSTISLFNRLRSQTVSTKYLGATRSMSVGGPRPFWFPTGDAEELATDSLADGGASSAATTTFVARNSVWDPFIIWIVNTQIGQVEIDAFNARIAENPTPIPGYPTPPTFALHPQCPPDLDGVCPSASGSSSSGEQSGHMDGDAMGQPQPHDPIPILYNQPVILQCVSTGMCSPVLTLRKIEKGSMAIGSFYGRDQSRDVLGDPVSQLHKVAFEVRVQAREELPAVTVTPAGLNTRVGSYLTCMGDIVGLNATCDGRQLSSDGADGSGKSGAAARGSSASQARKQAKEGASVGTTSWAEDVGDNAVWTMVGTDCAIYRFDYPPAPEIMAQLQQAATSAPGAPTNGVASSTMTTVPGRLALHNSLALPPTPTSPLGVQDYSQHSQQQQQQQQQFSLEMMLAEHGGAGTFQPMAMDPSLAAAVYGIGMGSGGGSNGLPTHLLPSSQPISSILAAASGAAVSGGGRAVDHCNLLQNEQQGFESTEGLGLQMVSDNVVPIVFKSSVLHPPTVNPSTLFGGVRRAGDNLAVAAGEERSYITLHGLNFTPDMVVVFDGQQSLFTEFKSSEGISCLGPLGSDFAGAIHGSTLAKGNGDYHLGSYAPMGLNKRQHPTSPSTSDSSSASSGAQSNEDTQAFPSLMDTDCQSHSQRASSTDSTASSATETLSNHSAMATLGKSGGSMTSRNPAKGSAGSVIKVPIYLSRNGGAGPTYKTGQFYTLHM